MARPTKQGVDYFPLDVHLDDKFKFIEIKYKLEGFAVLIKIIQKLYSYGYWYKWTEDETLLFSDEIRADFSLVDNVVKEAIERGIFDKNMYEKHKILTSKGIQKRYKEMVRRRKDVEVIDEYLLIDSISLVNDVNNSINDNTKTTPSKHGDGKSTQSKVNKSKVNKTKKDINKIQFADTVFLTQEEHEKLINDFGKTLIDDYIERLDEWQTNNPKKVKKDHNKTIRTWLKKHQTENKPQYKPNNRVSNNEIDPQLGF